ncbi:hypothetical protein [Aeromonas sp. S19(2024)]|uniref:phage tail tip protein J-related protein n=1 Tax=Aeromonas sp. S19(2024) TaxID=3242892 RepID=UPI00352725DF
MPAVAIPVIAGVAAGAGSALVVTTATAIAIGTAVASATMMITAKKPSLGDYRSASERSQILRAAASDKTCIYGRMVSSGLMSFAAEQKGEQDDGEWLHVALVISGHKLSRIGDIWLGDDLVGTFGDLVSYELHVDRQTCDPFMLANCADWQEDMIGQGITWLRISCKFDAEKFPAGLPNIKIEKFGKEVWDPRDGKWKWSRNAALVILDYYRTWLNVPDDELRIDEFIQAANICDEQVAIPGGGTEPRYSLDVEFDLGEARVKVLEAMHMACAAQPTYVGGKHGILAGAYYGPASDELRAHQIIGDLELLPEPSSSDKINQVAGTFVDPVTFKKTDFPAVIVPEWVEEDGGHPLIEDLDLRCVTSEHHAQRLANIILRQRRNARTLTCSVNLSGWRYRPGQTIKLYVPALGINGVEFRVTDWSFSLNGGVDLTLREDSPLFWADAIGKPMPRPEITGLPTGGAAMPDLLRYEVETVGEVLQGVLSWRNTGTVAYNQVIIQRLTQGAAPVTVMTAQVPGQSCRVNGLATGNYVALVRTVALTGAHSPVAAVNFVITAPAMPLGVDVEAGNWSLALRPRFAGGHDYGVLCEWWWSHIDHPLGEAMAKANPAGISSYMTMQGLRPDTEYFVWLRAVNAYGKSGLLAAKAKTSYDAASILDVLDGEIGAEHLREELRKPIADIPALSKSVTDLGGALSALDKREKDVKTLLENTQNQLGANYISVTLIQEQLRQRIDRYNLDFTDFRDAVFKLDPETGQITMEAINAVRSELGAEISTVSQHLDAVEAIVKTCVTKAELTADLERITSVEQAIDGINGILAQTATKSEVTAVGSQVTQVGQELNAVKGTLSQKAAQSAVDAQGQRLTAAEQQISANTSATTATAQRIEQVKAELQQADATLSASVTDLAQAVATTTGAQAQRLQALEVLTGGHTAAITELQQVVTSEGQSLASKFENLQASVDLTAEAAVHGALGAAAEATRQREASGLIRRDQKVMAEQQQAMAQTIEQVSADFQTADAAISANLLSEQQARTTADEALGKRVDTVQAEVTSQGTNLAAGLQSEQEARVTADEALGRRVDTVQAEVTSQGANLAAGLQSEQEARVTADAALAQRVDTVQAKANEVSSAVQTVAEAHAGLNDAVGAGWYTKAQINGEGGGFGLSVKLAADGSTLTSFVVDADVFAVLSRVSGVTSKRNPFVIKNGITYLNKAMMDSADINSLVAAYISVTELVGLNIKGSSISGTNIIGGSLNIGAGKAIINSAGKATLQDADIIGKITALSGVLRNVTIEDTCKINGTLEAGQIVGDIVRVYDASNQAQINLGAVNFAREISFSIIVNSGREKTTGNAILNGTTVKTVTSTAIDVAGTISANTVSAAHVVTLPAGVSHTARFSWSGNGGYNSAYCLVIVSKK